MSNINVGGKDRMLRIVIGAALLVVFFFNRDASYGWVLLIGIVPLATGLFKMCPLYSVFGFSTCPMKET